MANLRVSGIDHILLKISTFIENKNQRNVFSFILYQPCFVEKFSWKSKFWSELSGRFLGGQPLKYLGLTCWFPQWKLVYRHSFIHGDLHSCFHAVSWSAGASATHTMKAQDTKRAFKPIFLNFPAIRLKANFLNRDKLGIKMRTGQIQRRFRK